MRTTLLTAALALSSAPGALAQDPPPAAPERVADVWPLQDEPQPAPAPAPSPADRIGGACGRPETIGRALRVLRVAARDRLPGRPGATVALRVRPCFAGRLRLEVRHARTGGLLAVARRTVGDRDVHTLRLVTTPAIRRYAGRRAPLRLVVTLRPRL